MKFTTDEWVSEGDKCERMTGQGSKGKCCGEITNTTQGVSLGSGYIKVELKRIVSI
jgi:hypothetical protein